MTKAEMKFTIYDDSGLFYYEIGPDNQGLDILELRYYEREDDDKPYKQADIPSGLLNFEQAAQLRDALTALLSYYYKNDKFTWNEGDIK